MWKNISQGFESKGKCFYRWKRIMGIVASPPGPFLERLHRAAEASLRHMSDKHLPETALLLRRLHVSQAALFSATIFYSLFCPGGP